jgi:hypothetical protein
MSNDPSPFRVTVFDVPEHVVDEEDHARHFHRLFDREDEDVEGVPSGNSPSQGGSEYERFVDRPSVSQRRTSKFSALRADRKPGLDQPRQNNYPE